MDDPRVVANKAVVRRYVEEYQIGRREEVADELVAEQFVHHAGPGWAQTITGKAFGKPQFVAMLHAAFPDLDVVIHDQIGEGDLVVTRKTFRGTHNGEFMGIAPTGNRVAIDVIDIIGITDGQLTEHWTCPDMLGLMQQLGALPLGWPLRRPLDAPRPQEFT
jgi:predicted ester cyclase